MPSESDQLSDLIADAAQRAAGFLAANPSAPAFPGQADIDRLRTITDDLPVSGRAAADVLAELDRLGSPAATRSTGGRYFGFVTGGTEPAALAASILSGAWDQNTALPAMSPVATHLDEIAARWMVEILELPETATATFCGGASLANLTCIIAGRDALLDRKGWSVAEQGLAGAPPLRVITGAEAHVSVDKALRNAGVGRAQVESVPTDDNGALRAELLPDLDDRPTLIVLQAGNVNTGHSDPFADVIPKAREAGAWVHVDGAFGLWAAASPDLAHLVDGVSGADSWATDAHKWLNVSYDSGVAICANGDDLARSMTVDAAYLSARVERANLHLGLQMSQRARGVEVWAVLAALGRDGVADLVQRSCAHAGVFADRLTAAGVDILATPVLNQVLAAFGPSGDEGDLATDRVIDAVQADGTCWMGATTWQGRRAMRISVSDRSTTAEDVERSVAAVLRVRDLVC